jgi:hypothetical protein
MAFAENKAGVQLFFGRKQLEMELQSHVKNQSFDKFDVFYRQYSFGIQIIQNHWLSIMKVLQFRRNN